MVSRRINVSHGDRIIGVPIVAVLVWMVFVSYSYIVVAAFAPFSTPFSHHTTTLPFSSKCGSLVSTTASSLTVLQLSLDNESFGSDKGGSVTTKTKKGVRSLVTKLLHFGGREAVESEDVTQTKSDRTSLTVRRIEEAAAVEGEAATAMDTINLAKTTTADAFEQAEADLDETDRTLLAIRSMLEEAEARQEAARTSLAEARQEANNGLKAAEKAAAQAIAQAQKAESMIASLVAKDTTTVDDTEMVVVDQDHVGMIKEQKLIEIDISSLSYEDVDYHLHEMASPFLDENQCLIPGETVVRVEKAPENSRRIFAGIDIIANVDDVWKLLTNYERLQDVVPNLVVNDVLELYEPSGKPLSIDPTLSDEEQCEKISKQLRGAKLRQVGGAKVVGINFSARTTLEVREWPEGMPDFAHYDDDVYDGKSRNKRAKEGRGLPLKRYRFPRPFSLSSLPYKCVSMQSVENDDGEFRMYQGVWRMQPLVGCAPPGGSAMRLTYAVEISPRPYLPVALVENRIAQDLCKNLEAIRDFVS